MSLIITLIVGGIVGWLASLVMGTDAQQGIFLNIIIGIIGAFIGSWLFGTVLGLDTASQSGNFSFVGVFWAVLGAVILIGILKALDVLK